MNCSHNGTGHYENLFLIGEILMKLLNYYKKMNIKFNITVHGNCMDPIIKNGDIITIQPSESYKVGDVVLCMDRNQVIYIHRIYKIDGDNYITKADNNLCVDGQMMQKLDIYGKALL